jgi:DNA polymerase
MTMDLVGLDFESFYATDYSLSNKEMTTEAYVRDPRFEPIMVSVKVNSAPAAWYPRDSLQLVLDSHHLHEHAVYSHHAHFDMFILNHHFNIRPKLILDTLGMARAIHGANGGLSLAKLCERYGIGSKGTEVLNAKGKRFKDFTPWELAKYGEYCINDIEKTYLLLMKFMPQFAKSELKIYDHIVRMFTEPVFDMDVPLLTQYRDWLANEKITLLLRAGVQVDDVMSNEKFAQCLEMIGIDPPRKISKTTGKLTWAFAKTDVGMQTLQEHPDETVQVLVEARLKNKTTIAEKGATRLIAMAERGAATVYLKVAGASGTHRLSGGDKFNWQSMKRGSDLRNAVRAPKGHVCVVVDSSTIEARLLDWISGQDDMVEVYAKADKGLGPDMYCVIGEHTYGFPMTKKSHPEERQMGKRIKLGLGFGMGSNQFGVSVRREAKGKDGKPLVLTPDFCQYVVQDVYRKLHPYVTKLWRKGEQILGKIAAGEIGVALDHRGIVKTCDGGLVMPNGLKILYPELKWDPELEADGITIVKDQWGKPRGEWSFWNGKMREKIYGPKVIENIIQCLARIIVFTQCLWATERATAEGIWNKWAHSVHDEGVFVVEEWYGPRMMQIAEECFRTPLHWCMDLPLNCEAGVNNSYGRSKT